MLEKTIETAYASLAETWRLCILYFQYTFCFLFFVEDFLVEHFLGGEERWSPREGKTYKIKLQYNRRFEMWNVKEIVGKVKK